MTSPRGSHPRQVVALALSEIAMVREGILVGFGGPPRTQRVRLSYFWAAKAPAPRDVDGALGIGRFSPRPPPPPPPRHRAVRPTVLLLYSRLVPVPECSTRSRRRSHS